MPSYRHILVVLTVAGAATGCNVAHQRAMERVKLAQAQGDTVGLALAWRDACRADRNDTRACTEADRVAREITDAAVAAARPSCEQGEVDACLDALEPARRVEPDARPVLDLVDRAGRTHVDRCSAFPVQSPADALSLVSCIAEKRARIGTATYRGLEAAQRERAAGAFATRALDPQVSGSAAARYALWTGANCLAPRSPATLGLEASKAQFESAARIPFSIRVAWDSAEPALGSGERTDVVDAICPTLGEAVACVPPGTPGAVEVQAIARIGQLGYDVTEQRRQLEYVAGYRKVPNPDYTTLLEERIDRANTDAQARADRDEWDDRCRRANRRLADAGNCVRCRERADVDEACGNARKAHTYAQRTGRDLADVDTQLANAPRELQEPVHERFGYVERAHRWTGEWVVELYADGRLVTTAQGTVDHVDLEHVGSRRAGLAEDPFEGFPPATVETPVNAKTHQLVAERVRTVRLERARERAAGCAASPAWSAEALACWAESQRWANGSVAGGDFVQAAASWSHQSLVVDCW